MIDFEEYVGVIDHAYVTIVSLKTYSIRKFHYTSPHKHANHGSVHNVSVVPGNSAGTMSSIQTS